MAISKPRHDTLHTWTTSMHRLPLDPANLAVTTFDPAPTRAQVAMAASVDTNDEVCYCLSIMPEDCFGPTAGCSTDHTEA